MMVLTVPLILLSSGGCKKDNFGTSALTFSTDTLTFDTVFASLGSTTRYFKVFNDSRSPVTIADISLKHLVGTQFRMNVDGQSGDHFTNVEIPARDSIYVFVEVTVNPNSQQTPYIIIDDVDFTVGDNTETVHLQAFGQNAHYHFGQEISSSQTWNNDLPHVIISSDTVPGVYVRCGATLTIQPGCKIFFANNSALFVEGILKADGGTSWSDSTVFQGVRLEQYYDDKPGQWFGLVFLRTNSCVAKGFLKYCVVTESSYSIYSGAGLGSTISDYLNPAFSPEVTMDNVIIKNSLYDAVYGFNGKVTARNCLMFAAGDNLVKLSLGGEYNFTNCTMYNTGSRYVGHEIEALELGNAVVVEEADGSKTLYHAPLTTNFANSVLYGNLRNEVSYNNFDGLNLGEFTNHFSYCSVKTNADTLSLFCPGSANNQFNQDPRFKKAEDGDFTPWDSIGYFSPLIDASPSGLNSDLYGNARPATKVNPPNGTPYDIGAIEAQ